MEIPLGHRETLLLLTIMGKTIGLKWRNQARLDRTRDFLYFLTAINWALISAPVNFEIFLIIPNFLISLVCCRLTIRVVTRIKKYFIYKVRFKCGELKLYSKFYTSKILSLISSAIKHLTQCWEVVFCIFSTEEPQRFWNGFQYFVKSLSPIFSTNLMRRNLFIKITNSCSAVNYRFYTIHEKTQQPT